jgi:putative transposase
MGRRRLVMYFHIIWGTLDGNPWISSKIERPVFRCIVNQIHKLGFEVLVINGISDHIHIVVKLKSTVSVAQLVKLAKGVSSKFINERLGDNE